MDQHRRRADDPTISRSDTEPAEAANGRNRNQPVAVEWMPCHFGGDHAWWRCPACCRRAAILYGAEVFACRHCLKLAYESQREAPHFRALRRAQGIQGKLGDGHH